MTLTKKQINAIIKNTPAELKGQQAKLAEKLGSFQRADANWSYHAGWTYDGQLVVTVYGEIQ